MTSAKEIKVAAISSKDAVLIVKKNHYSGKIVPNSQLHLGVFLKNKLEGVMQFGPSMDKRKIQGLVSDTSWNGFLELNRMAFSDNLPKNSESRALSIAFKIIKKQYPHIEWIISFADGTQCGDGAIYRASGFVLTGIKKNMQILQMPDGTTIARKTLDNPQHTGFNGKFGSAIAKENGAKPLAGFQFRYIYFINKEAQKRLTIPVLTFDKIDEQNAGMYKGEKITRAARRPKKHELESPSKSGRCNTDPDAPLT